MFSADRTEFDAHLSALYGAWGRGPTDSVKEGYWKGLQLMTLADFVRCCGKAIQRYTEDSSYRLPDVGALWALKRALRALPAVNREQEASWAGDHWDEKSNLHLLAYVYKRGGMKHYYDERSTRILVHWTRSWAMDMRQSAGDGTLPEDHGKAWWESNMQRAEAQITEAKAA